MCPQQLNEEQREGWWESWICEEAKWEEVISWAYMAHQPALLLNSHWPHLSCILLLNPLTLLSQFFCNVGIHYSNLCCLCILACIFHVVVCWAYNENKGILILIRLFVCLYKKMRLLCPHEYVLLKCFFFLSCCQQINSSVHKWQFILTHYWALEN